MTRAGRAGIAILTLVIGIVVAAVLLLDGSDPPKQAAPGAPNFVVIMTDDQALNTWNRDVMPRTFARMVDEGTDFEQAFAVPPLCCPARASFLTGRYPHNHGVLSNNYKALEDPEDVLPVWLSDAGYETMMAGKFLNGYERVEKTEKGFEPAPGWDEWWGVTGLSRKYFDYEASVDGKPVSYGSSDDDYVTNALTDAAVDFIGGRSPEDPPFFLWMPHFAPHFAPRDKGGVCPPNSAPTPLPSDYKAARDARLPTDRSFYEPNVKDKPPFIASGPPRPQNRGALERTYRCTVAAMAAVDRSVDEVFATLEESGQAEETVVFFISDNGYFFGEHRKRIGKKIPYDPALRVPLAAVVPEEILGDKPVPTIDGTVGTVDLAPTMLELAGLESEHRVDGRSLLGALRGEEEALPTGRKLVIELGQADRCKGYLALRDRAFLYTQYRKETAQGECGVSARELYDVRSDPLQLRNLLGARKVDPADAALADALAERMELLGTCSGIGGRDPPRETPFCE